MRVFIVPVFLGLLACSSNTAPTVSPPPTSNPSGTQSTMAHLQGDVTYRCDGGSQIQANYGAKSVSIRWNGRDYPLAVDPAASGDPVYRNAVFQWKVEGRTASLVERGRPVATGCQPG